MPSYSKKIVDTFLFDKKNNILNSKNIIVIDSTKHANIAKINCIFSNISLYLSGKRLFIKVIYSET